MSEFRRPNLSEINHNDDGQNELSNRTQKMLEVARTNVKSKEDALKILEHFVGQACGRFGIFEIQRNRHGNKRERDSQKAIIEELNDLCKKLGIDDWSIDDALVKYLQDIDQSVVTHGHNAEHFYKKSRTTQDADKDNVSVFPLRNVEGGGWYQDMEFGVRQRREAMQFLSKTDKIESSTIQYIVDRMRIDDVDYRENFSILVEILSKEPAKAAECLMKFIKKEQDPYLKALATRTLYQLELGKIGMSKDGVDYLGKKFDLGENNDPNHFAHRATGNGQVAIFDENRRALGYFQLHNLDSPEDKIKAELLEFTYDTLFHAKPDETQEERQEREDVLEEFKKRYFDTYITDFHEQTGVRFNNLNFKEQGWFLWYVQRASEEDKRRAMEFITKYREDGFKTFLSLEQDAEAGEKILNIGEKIDKKSAEKIFKQYQKIAATADDLGGYLGEYFTNDKKFDQATLDKLTNGLLSRAKDLLIDFSQKSNEKDNQKTVEEALTKLNVDLIIFAATFKTLFKGKGRVEFEEIRGLDFQRQPIDWLSDHDKSEMLSIAKANWSPRGKAGEGVISEFGETLTHGKDIDFYVLRRDGKIISFVRFDAPTQGGHRYAGSFNVDQQYRGSAVGEAMIYNALDKQAEKYVLDATVYPKLDVGTKYVEQTGFTITNVLHNYDNSGEDFFEITCDRRKNKNFVSREASKETLMTLASTGSEKNWRGLIGQNLIVLKFDAEKEHERVLQATEGLISEGYIGARYFADPNDKKKRYYVFEFDKTKEQAMPMAATA